MVSPRSGPMRLAVALRPRFLQNPSASRSDRMTFNSFAADAAKIVAPLPWPEGLNATDRYAAAEREPLASLPRLSWRLWGKPALPDLRMGLAWLRCRDIVPPADLFTRDSLNSSPSIPYKFIITFFFPLQ